MTNFTKVVPIGCLIFLIFSRGVIAAENPVSLGNAVPVISEGEKFLKNREKEKREREFTRPTIKAVKQTIEDKEDTACIQVNTINLEGVTVFSTQKIKKYLNPLEGKCIGPNALNNAIKKINNAYIDAGFITTRAYLPKQKIGKDKAIRVVVVEGFIESIELNDNKGKDKYKNITAFPIGVGNKLQLRKIEQGLDQLNRVKSGKAKMKLWPGDKIGGTKVKVTNTPVDETRGYLTFDNEGQEASGQQRIRFGLEKDNILGINDSWSLYYIGSRDTNALAVDFSMGYKNWDLNYSWSNSEYVSFLTENTELYGLTDTHTLKIKHLFKRDATSITKNTFELVARDPRRFINDIELTPTQSGHIRLGIEKITTKDNKRLSLTAGLTKGLNILGGGSNSIGNDFIKFDVGITKSGSLKNRWQYNSELNFQYSPDPLLSSEQVNIGSLHTVRGFRDTPLSGDSGFYFRNTGTYYPKCVTNNFKSLCKKSRLYTFFDSGLTYTSQKNRFGEKYGWLGGIGGGVKYSGKYLSWDMGLSRGIFTRNDNVDKKTTLYLTATYKAF